MIFFIFVCTHASAAAPISPTHFLLSLRAQKIQEKKQKANIFNRVLASHFTAATHFVGPAKSAFRPAGSSSSFVTTARPPKSIKFLRGLAPISSSCKLIIGFGQKLSTPSATYVCFCLYKSITSAIVYQGSRSAEAFEHWCSESWLSMSAPASISYISLFCLCRTTRCSTAVLWTSKSANDLPRDIL